MNFRWFAPVAMVVLLAGCLQSWKEYSSADGQYSVLMPGTPTEKMQNRNTAAGDITAHAALLDKTPVVYMVMYNDYPEQVMQGGSPSQILENARDGGVRSARGKLVGDSAITLLNKYPGREIQIEMPDGLHAVRIRVYMVKNRMYQVAYRSGKDNLFSKDATKFLDSFKIQE